MEKYTPTPIDSSIDDTNFNILPKKFDQRKFEILSKSPEVTRSLEKIINKCGKEAFKKEWETLEKMDMSKAFSKILEKYPGTWLLISKLGINTKEKKFSKLTGEQKITCIALYQTLFLGQD